MTDVYTRIHGQRVLGSDMHPPIVVYLEHDGKVLLVDQSGEGPKHPVQGRLDGTGELRFPTEDEVKALGIEWLQKDVLELTFSADPYRVIKAYPKITWPKEWCWKDACIADNNVHPVARESIYRSLHRLGSKVMVVNGEGHVLMGKVERGHFNGFWTLPGGYMDHNEHPAIGCVRETLEEMGLSIVLDDVDPVITQRVFNREGISFVSFTYRSTWDGDIADLELLTEEISEAKWFTPSEALANAVSHFDKEALRALNR